LLVEVKNYKGVLEAKRAKDVSDEEKMKVLKMAKDFFEEATIEEESKKIQ
jgi:hypothetical protein